MTSVAPSLAEQYAAALQEYLRESGETALSQAYELGREALGSGIGVLDIATIYRDAVNAAVLRGEAAQKGFSRAAEFFSESLAPFEMTFRGYADANQRLQALNRTLAAQNVELRNARAMAEAANQELESFSYSVAHDLRAPLRHIAGYSEMLIEGWSHALDEQGQDYLRRLRTAARRMADLIEDLLRLSRVTRADLRCRQVDLSVLALSVAAELERAAPEHSVRCVIAEGLVAEGDVRLLRVVFDNLLGNAWKFTGKVAQPVVEVGRVAKDGQPTYFVRDNGAGFDPAYASRLFTPFQRLHPETDFPGTGVGLATVQRIVRRHGGQIWAEGAIGQGATFFWTLGP
jgi:light-regulated signal transduction histidine kinase (bacteriophytochrome)